MLIQLVRWRILTLKMLSVFQSLFLLTASWDFFTTIIITSSARSKIFFGLSIWATSLVTIMWISGIFLAACLLVVSMFTRKYTMLNYGIDAQYSMLSTVYVILFIVGIFNTLVPWTIILNYATNLIWAVSLVIFRILINREPL